MSRSKWGWIFAVVAVLALGVWLAPAPQAAEEEEVQAGGAAGGGTDAAPGDYRDGGGEQEGQAGEQDEDDDGDEQEGQAGEQDDDGDDGQQGENDDGDVEEDEEDDDLAVEELPPAVVDAVQAALPGARILEAGREEEDGVLVYEVEGLTAEGQEFELEVSPEGQVLEQELGEDDDGEGGDRDSGQDEDDDREGGGAAGLPAGPGA